jgi:hypothetical protein
MRKKFKLFVAFIFVPILFFAAICHFLLKHENVFSSAQTDQTAKSIVQNTYKNAKSIENTYEVQITNHKNNFQVSPTLGLDDLIKAFEEDVIRTAERTAEETLDFQATIYKMRKSRDKGETKWGSEKWMKPPEYYRNLDTVKLVEDCFSRPIFALEMQIYENPIIGYHSLKIFHNGFTELFEREDLWRGLLHIYDVLSAKISAESDLSTIMSASDHLRAIEKLYMTSPFREQVKGREKEFLVANLKVLQRYKKYLEEYDYQKLGTEEGSAGVFGEPCSVARVALMLAKQVNPSQYARIEPAITNVRWPMQQRIEDLKSFIDLVTTSLEGFVTEE